MRPFARLSRAFSNLLRRRKGHAKLRRRAGMRRLLCESLEDRRVFAGIDIPTMRSYLQPFVERTGDKYVTVVTHGFQIFNGDGDSMYDVAKDIRQTTDEINGAPSTWLIDYDLSGDVGVFSAETDTKGSIMPGTPNHVVLLYDWAWQSNEGSAGWGGRLRIVCSR